MTIVDFANYLLVDPASESLVDYQPWYVGFNFFESACWLFFAVVVAVRHARYRKTPFEALYALAFLLFAFTDLVETTGLTVMLLLFKMACFLALIPLRKLVLMHYPSWRF